MTMKTYMKDEETIVDFSKKNNLRKKRNKLLKGEKKLEELKRRPISRERRAVAEEIQKDDSEMAKKIPITKRIQRKEEEALGHNSEEKSFSQALEELSDNPETVLMQAKTAIPFALNQESITIDPIKIKIVTNNSFMSQQTQIILIKDILESSVETSPFLATLQIVVSHKKETPLRINYLKKDDAEKAAKIIQGLIIARSESPDVSKVEAIR